MQVTGGAGVSETLTGRKAPGAGPWPNPGFSRGQAMGNKIVTEADRKRTPAPRHVEGYLLRREGCGQRRSLERGRAIRNKKNPGKRTHKGGS